MENGGNYYSHCVVDDADWLDEYVSGNNLDCYVVLKRTPNAILAGPKEALDEINSMVGGHIIIKINADLYFRSAVNFDVLGIGPREYVETSLNFSGDMTETIESVVEISKDPWKYLYDTYKDAHGDQLMKHLTKKRRLFRKPVYRNMNSSTWFMGRRIGVPNFSLVINDYIHEFEIVSYRD